MGAMRCLVALAALSARACAWSLQPAPAALTQRTSAASLTNSPRAHFESEGLRAQGPTSVGFGTLLGAGAALAVLGALRHGRQGARTQRQRWALVARRAEAEEVVRAYVDPVTRKKNWVNPWEQRVKFPDDYPKDAPKTGMGHRFYKYTGPVYKQVPVIEGLTFPLDPTKYYEPLEPPPPGAKWGDGRSPDGNWYMEVDGQQVQYWQGWGRRKTACAIVRIAKGSGQFLINGRDAIDYFTNYHVWWLKACEPLAALSQKNNFDLICKVFGGGLSGQAGAIRYALAKAMQEYEYQWRPLLKKAKYLTRDWRTVESKKPGRPKARKKTPYHKR